MIDLPPQTASFSRGITATHLYAVRIMLSMDAIYRATPSHLHQVRQVLRKARHRFVNFGDEDLITLLHDGVAIIGALAAQPWGVMILQRERRPDSLPAAALSRAYLRGVALTTGRSPIVDVPRLYGALNAELQSEPPLQTIVYCDDWLVPPLKAAGFTLVDRLQYLELSRLQSRVISSPATLTAADINLRAAGPDDLAALAQLDAQVFPPIWHFGVRDLMTLLLAGRVQLAMHNEQIAGYSALSMQVNSPSGNVAQLARLAVHPAAQSAGIGRLLLTDVIDYARANLAESIALNTQSSNQRSLALYRAVGFRNTGTMTPVLTHVANAETQDGI